MITSSSDLRELADRSISGDAPERIGTDVEGERREELLFLHVDRKEKERDRKPSDEHRLPGRSDALVRRIPS